jgi:hypothetical protein
MLAMLVFTISLIWIVSGMDTLPDKTRASPILTALLYKLPLLPDRVTVTRKKRPTAISALSLTRKLLPVAPVMSVNGLAVESLDCH